MFLALALKIFVRSLHLKAAPDDLSTGVSPLLFLCQERSQRTWAGELTLATGPEVPGYAMHTYSCSCCIKMGGAEGSLRPKNEIPTEP